MATSTYPNMGGAVGVSDVGTFIPSIWSDQIVAAYKKSLVLANLVRKMPMKGKKGDTIYVPKPTRGVASLKVENTAVTLQNATESEVAILIDKHYEYSRLIEDIVEKQALSSLVRFYTEDAGYALAKQVDTDLFALGKSLGNGTGSSWVHSRAYQFNTSTGALETYDADGTADIGAFNDDGLRDAIQVLDDDDVPMEDRVLVIPPSARNSIMGITRYSSSDFIDGRPVQNGKIGNLYGVDVYVSTNCPVIETGVKAGLLMNRDAFVLAEQMGVRTQTQYKQEYLGDLFTADTIYGVKTLRPENGLVLALPA
jgi:N4-gp56 family major capsid protein